MANLCVLTLVLFLALQVFASGKKIDFLQHVKRIRSLPCKEPQMRAIRTSEIINTGVSTKIFPEMTVLHRCDSGSGCCSGGDRYTCYPKTMEDVKLTFLIHSPKHGEVYETVVVKNHTKCACADKSEIR